MASDAPQPNSATVTSTTLLARLAEGGDEAAGAEFVARYGPMIALIARGAGVPAADAEDIQQEVIMAAVDALRSGRYHRDRGQFKSFLKGVIFHKLVDFRNAKIRQRLDSPSAPRTGGSAVPDLSLIPDSRQPSPSEDFERRFEAEWQKVAFEEALDEVRHEVDPLTFQAFDLYARKAMRPNEVAKLLGISRNAVYIAKTRVLERVRQKLRAAGQGP